ncbi:hypothetical protein MVEN_00782200 [Mycena venus]|uniref:Uncharacterized protein n=1 Tax=Mycena venus TaxID=2733690 RepID=A0A8H6YLK2_9AGAR|nr:hypothetical protein MVEN_00782200 [Mycena venus]
MRPAANFTGNPIYKKMANKVALYERDVQMRVAGARKKLENFTTERIALVDAIVEHAAVCRDWARQSAIRREKDTNAKFEARYNAIKDKFIQLGYTESDISSIEFSTSVRQTTQLTDRIWNTIYPKLEPTVRASKDRRLQREREIRTKARTRVVEDIYKEYKKTLVPTQWRFLPGLHEVLHYPAFSVVVNAADDVNVETTHFDEAVSALPGFIVSWTAARKVELVKLIKDAQSSSGSSGSEGGSTFSVPGTQLLDLATAVFDCAQENCTGRYSGTYTALIGWESAAAHHCRNNRLYNWGSPPPSIETVLKFSSRGYMAAASLVTLAGLNEKHATAAEMDNLDLRFLCIACIPRIHKQTENHFAFSWRAAVSHFASTSHPAPLWRKLNSAETQRVKNNEGSDPTSSWSCCHCSHHLDHYERFASVSDHVKTVHAIANPSAPTDLFRFLDLQRTPATFSIFRPQATSSSSRKPAAGTAQYHCLKCTGPGPSRRLFIFEGVKSHLKAKHQVLEPLKDRDWKQA